MLNNVDVKFELRNGRVFIDPFETKMGSSTFLIAGDQGIDQTMNYAINMAVPRSEFGQAANTAINNLYGKASSAGINITPSENINMSVKVTGTFKDPKIKLDLKDNVKQTTQAIKEEITRAAKEELDKRKDEAKAVTMLKLIKLSRKHRNRQTKYVKRRRKLLTSCGKKSPRMGKR